MNRARRIVLRNTYAHVDTGYGDDLRALLDHCDRLELRLKRANSKMRRLTNATKRLIRAVKNGRSSP